MHLHWLFFPVFNPALTGAGLARARANRKHGSQAGRPLSVNEK
jgi:hypothetical protein